MLKQIGITLIETLLAIVVGAAIVLLGLRYYNAARLNAEVVQASSQINTIIQASYEWLEAQRQADFEGDSNPITITQLFDSGLLTEASKTDPWGGSVSVSPGSDTNYVLIKLPNAPLKACKSLVSQMEAVAQTEMSLSDCSAGDGYSGEF